MPRPSASVRRTRRWCSWRCGRPRPGSPASALAACGGGRRGSRRGAPLRRPRRRVRHDERVGEHADGDVVEARPAPGGLAHERVLERGGGAHEHALSSRSASSQSASTIAVRPGPRSVDLAQLVACEDRALCGVRLRVLGRVERAGRRALPHDVGDDARADHGRAIASALAGSFRPVWVEAVTEGSPRVMGEEAVLALPAGAVPGADRVDVDVPSVRVEGNAVPRRAESEDRLAACTSIGRRGGGSGGRTSRSRCRAPAAGPTSATGAAPTPRFPRRRRAVVRQRPLPRLDSPVGPVRRRARGDTPGERRPAVQRPHTFCPIAPPAVREKATCGRVRLGSHASTAPHATTLRALPPSGTRPVHGHSHRPAGGRSSRFARSARSRARRQGGARSRRGTRGSWLRNVQPGVASASPLARGRGRGHAGHSTCRDGPQPRGWG